MKKCYYYLLLFGVIFILSAALLYHRLNKSVPVIDQYALVDKIPAIHPDYTGTVIPPNIAPLNFIVKEPAGGYYVKIYSEKGDSIEITSNSSRITIPIKRWRKLLNNNRGCKLNFDIYTKNENNNWLRFKTITNKIANENIDAYLVYRRLPPLHRFWKQMGIYQRNLENFHESLVLGNKAHQGICLNCHSFCNNSTQKILFGVRSAKYGSSALLVDDGVAGKIATKFTYIAWHPSGRLAVYSINKVQQFFHSARGEVRGVLDLDSMLAYYSLDSKTVKTTPNLSMKDRLETYPAWSPDGRYLYFCSAPVLWPEREETFAQKYDQVKYDLLRISYDIDNDQWGRLETVLLAKDTGLSILQPRISPDGRWLLFCMSDYGSFLVYHQSSDLYLIDLEAARKTGQYKYQRLDINSDQSESWHSFSSNSRWIAFSSKRDYGEFTRTYFSYIDEKAKPSKPFILPQKDPAFYDSCLETFSVPELVIEPVLITGEKLGKLIRGSEEIDVEIPITMATPKADSASEPWQQLE